MSLIYGVANPAMQKTLVELCFGQPSPQAIAQLEQAIIDDSLSGEQLRILPYVATRVPFEAFSSFVASRIKGIYKHTLYRNRLLLDRASRLSAQLQAAGYTAPTFLKGVPATLQDLEYLGKRPMADLDLLIPGFDIREERAQQILANPQYRVKGFSIRSVTFTDREGFEYDLHWYINDWSLKAISLQKLIAHQQLVCALGYQFVVPCVEHHLAIVLAHGVFTPRLTYDARWVIDVLDILVRNQVLDQAKLLDFLKDFSGTTLLARAMERLVIDIPDNIVFDRAGLLTVSRQLPQSPALINFLISHPPLPNLPNVNLSLMNQAKYLLFRNVICPLTLIFKNRLPVRKVLAMVNRNTTSEDWGYNLYLLVNSVIRSACRVMMRSIRTNC